MVLYQNRWRSEAGDTLRLFGNDTSFWERFNKEIKDSQDITVKIKPNSAMIDVVKQINREYGDHVGAYIQPVSSSPVSAPLNFLVVYARDKDAGYVIDNAVQGSNSPFYSDSSNIVYGRNHTLEEEILTTKNLIPCLDSENTNYVLEQLDSVIKYTDSERAKLGAIQNRLYHAINNLSQSGENVSSSKSQIQDADFARETTNLTKHSILKEAGLSMLAQARGVSKSVSSLLNNA
ncbi:TPA: hypothetical protein RQJ47_002539 [Vibrio vulnificus]|nr:hypothetical protein [Vibrio vulnificus]HDY8209483.1 hypothetical protein [Vibrio vulnificus]